MVAVGSPLLPLDEADLADNQDHDQDEDHLGVHLRVARVLLVHAQVFVVPSLLRRELVPLDAVPVNGDILVVVAMTVA